MFGVNYPNIDYISGYYNSQSYTSKRVKAAGLYVYREISKAYNTGNYYSYNLYKKIICSL